MMKLPDFMKKERTKDALGEEDDASSKYAKAVLIVASVASMIGQFNMPNIKLLVKLGYSVDVAANFIDGSTCTDRKITMLMETLDALSIDCYQIDFNRNVLNIKDAVKAFDQLHCVICGIAEPVNRKRHHKICKNRKYDFIHAHSPIGGVIGRIAAKIHGIRTIYTAHGFHFYNGAPLKNWLIYYPVEWQLSRITDVLITITREDYKRAKKKFYAGKTVYIPGIGIDVGAYAGTEVNREAKRCSLGAGSGDIILLSVGELNKNKNHKAVIEALGAIRKLHPALSCHLHYCIAGRGRLHNELIKLADALGVNLHLLGYRDDVPELLKASDIFVLPSVREGLNVSLMEAMASGLPCIVSDIRGNRDLIEDMEQRFCSLNGLQTAILRFALLTSFRNHYGIKNQKKVEKFDLCQVMKKMLFIYR